MANCLISDPINNLWTTIWIVLLWDTLFFRELLGGFLRRRTGTTVNVVGLNMICNPTTLYWKIQSTLRTHRQTLFILTFTPVYNKTSLLLCLGLILSCLSEPSHTHLEISLAYSIAHLIELFYFHINMFKAFPIYKKKAINKKPLTPFFSPQVLSYPFKLLYRVV